MKNKVLDRILQDINTIQTISNYKYEQKCEMIRDLSEAYKNIKGSDK